MARATRVDLPGAWLHDQSHVYPFAVPSSGAATTGEFLLMEQVIRFDGPDHDVKEQYFTLADGTGTRWLAHRYTYTTRREVKKDQCNSFWEIFLFAVVIGAIDARLPWPINRKRGKQS